MMADAVISWQKVAPLLRLRRGATPGLSRVSLCIAARRVRESGSDETTAGEPWSCRLAAASNNEPLFARK